MQSKIINSYSCGINSHFCGIFVVCASTTVYPIPIKPEFEASHRPHTIPPAPSSTLIHSWALEDYLHCVSSIMHMPPTTTPSKGLRQKPPADSIFCRPYPMVKISTIKAAQQQITDIPYPYKLHYFCYQR